VGGFRTLGCLLYGASGADSHFVSVDSRSHLLAAFSQVVLRFIGEDICALPVKCMIPVACRFLNSVCLDTQLQYCVFLMSQYKPITFSLMSHQL
jgi:hypothetical protein